MLYLVNLYDPQVKLGRAEFNEASGEAPAIDVKRAID